MRANEAPLPQVSDNWLTVAINRTSGYLLNFYLGSLRSLWQTRAQEKPLIESILQALARRSKEHHQPPRLRGFLLPLTRIYWPEWTRAGTKRTSCPCWPTPASPRSREQCWDGYLVWGNWSQEMLPELLQPI